jgi:hypothetical protein
MRAAVKVVLVLGILGALAVGLLGPLVAAGHLHDYANTAAKAGYDQLVSSDLSSSSVEQAVSASVARHPNVTVTAVRITNGTVTVVLQQKVHSFMSGFPGLKGWFTVNATESASAFG